MAGTPRKSIANGQYSGLADGHGICKKKRRSEFLGRGANRGVAIFRSADYSLRK
jgi:hypothetical protein